MVRASVPLVAPSARRLSLRGLLGVLAAGAVVALVVVFAAGWVAVKHLVTRIEAENTASGVERVRAALARRALLRRHVVREYAWWDDTWAYVARPNGPGAEHFLRENFVDWMPAQYGDRHVGIWTRDRHPVFRWTDSAAAGAEQAFARHALFDLLDTARSVGGYLGTPRGMYLVGGAVVVPTGALTGAGPWRGYLLLGAPFSDSVLTEVAAELREALALRPADASLHGSGYATRAFAGGDSLETRFLLHDLLGQPAATVVVRRSRAALLGLRRRGQAVFLGAVAVGVVLLVSLGLLADRRMVRPVDAIVSALEEMRRGGHLTKIAAEAPSQEWDVLLQEFNRTVERLEASEVRLRRAQKMEALGTLAGGVAHDFNNLLGAVLAAAACVREDLGSSHPAEASIEIIENSSRRAAELTRRLLNFVRREHFTAAPTDLNTVAANIAHMCSRTFDRAIRVQARLADALPSVRADVGQLEQALLNLCINARDAMPQGGVLSIATSVAEIASTGRGEVPLGPGTYVVLSVEDTGVGMSAAVQERLFEPFFTTKPLGKGTGLGLASAYGVVKGHGGEIAVRSEPGLGSGFDIYLPASADPAAVAPIRASPAPPSRGSETILLIDDEESLRRALGRGLRRLGYTVLEAEDGAAGIERLREHRHDVALVLLDVVMPGMGGVEAFTHLRALRPDLPVVISSGYSEAGAIQGLLTQGANAFLAKPCELVQLACLVREVLDAPAAAAIP